MSTVAIAQIAPAFLDLGRSLERAADAVGEAASNGASLVVFGETWLPGYPVWADAGLPWDDDAAKATYARLHANALEIPGPDLDVLAGAAREHGVCVVIGVNERDARYSRGTLYNTLLFLSDRGEVLGAHRKLVPTHSERVIWGMGDGSTLHVVDTPVGRIGGLICWEHWMPLARFTMHAKGEQIHVAVWPDTPEEHHLASRSYAFEGRCYVICAGQVLPLSAVPEDLPVYDRIEAMADDAGLIFTGGSGVIGPDGRWVVGPVGGETIVYADVDLGRIDEEHQSLDTAGHYHRPDVFRVVVDETPRAPIDYVRDGGATP
ncbi:MAG TPA: carbon-nitrogen hydrolase family protein [Actinomycetota bacterium]|nr:carbon-nitrogen hydrolase family protein [Actinomycetota bacterium]